MLPYILTIVPPVQTQSVLLVFVILVLRYPAQGMTCLQEIEKEISSGTIASLEIVMFQY
jgi:hypothetical protein